MSAWFDDHGWFIGEFPQDCVDACSHSGDCYEDCYIWRGRLDFTVPRKQAIQWLREFGAWPMQTDKYDTGLEDMSDEDLAIKVLWLACCDIREQGEWLGLIH